VWHGAFHCLIVNGQRGTALFQKRSAKKKIAPGKFDVSVGGHYAAGEDPRTTAPREIREEVGLEVAFDELLPMGRRISVYCFEPPVREFEFQDIFLLPRAVEADGLVLQREEVDGVIEMDIGQGIALLSGQVSDLEQLLILAHGERLSIRLSVGDMVPSLDRYHLKLLLLAQRYLKGDRSVLLI
jgi:8-oxo-dGTP pyrophosphatase MutT (NUDIX family)